MTCFDQFWDGKHMTYDHSFAMILAKVYIHIKLLDSCFSFIDIISS